MLASEIIRHRLAHQRLAPTDGAGPGDVVAALGAVQAQDYLGALWAIGLRSPGATETEVEQAIADRSFVRTWSLRGTLHFVPAPDVRWMLALLSPRMIAGSARRSRRRVREGGPPVGLRPRGGGSASDPPTTHPESDDSNDAKNHPDSG